MSASLPKWGLFSFIPIHIFIFLSRRTFWRLAFFSNDSTSYFFFCNSPCNFCIPSVELSPPKLACVAIKAVFNFRLKSLISSFKAYWGATMFPLFDWIYNLNLRNLRRSWTWSRTCRGSLRAEFTWLFKVLEFLVRVGCRFLKNKNFLSASYFSACIFNSLLQQQLIFVFLSLTSTTISSHNGFRKFTASSWDLLW